MLPQLRKLIHEFADSLVVIGVHSAKFPAERIGGNLRKAILRNDLDHPVVNDADFAIWQGFAVRAWPTFMFIDPRGYVIGKHEGEFDIGAMREFLRGAIDTFDADGKINRTPIALIPEANEEGTLRFPGKVLADQMRDRLYISDTGHHRLVVTNLNGEVAEIIGAGEPGFVDGDVPYARFTHPQGMALDPTGRYLYVADTGNHALRVIDLEIRVVTSIAGNGERAHGFEPGPARDTSLASPWDLTWFQDELWIAMAGMHQLWSFDPVTNKIAPAAGSGHESIHDGPLVSATFAQPSGITSLNGVIYVADSETSAVRKIDPRDDRVKRLVGRGLFEFGDVDARGDSVRLQHPLGVEVATEGDDPIVLIADSYNNKIKRLDPSTRDVSTLFGSGEHGLMDGSGEDAEFWEPSGLSLAGRQLYVADTNNHAIRVADLDTEIVRTLKIEGL